MIFKTLKSEATGFLDKYKAKDPAAYAAAQQAVGGLLILDGLTGIDNPFGGKKRPGIFGTLAGIVVGIILIFMPTILGRVTGITKMTATTTAKIVSVNPHQSTSTNSNGTTQTSTTCTPVATYTVDGKEYTQQSSYGSSGMCSLTAGQTTNINYNPDKPAQWATDAKTIVKFLKFFVWAGILAVITSLFTFTIRLLSIIFGWKILKSGRALAKSLPPGTDLSSGIKEIEHEFKTSLFGFSDKGPAAPSNLPQPPAPPTTPPSV